MSTLKDIAPTIADRIHATIPNCWQGNSLGKELQNFTSDIESVEKCDKPFGILSVKDSIINLKILDNNKHIVKQFTKSNQLWTNVN